MVAHFVQRDSNVYGIAYVNATQNPRVSFPTVHFVASTADGLDVIGAVGGGQVDFGGGVWRHDDGPLDALAGSAPVALDGAADGAVGAVDAVQAFNEGGAQFYRGVSGLKGADAVEVFVLPEEEVAEEHDVVGAVHAGVARVAVPEFPDGGGTAPGHVAP